MGSLPSSISACQPHGASTADQMFEPSDFHLILAFHLIISLVHLNFLIYFYKKVFEKLLFRTYSPIQTLDTITAYFNDMTAHSSGFLPLYSTVGMRSLPRSLTRRTAYSVYCFVRFYSSFPSTQQRRSIFTNIGKQITLLLFLILEETGTSNKCLPSQ